MLGVVVAVGVGVGSGGCGRGAGVALGRGVLVGRTITAELDAVVRASQGNAHCTLRSASTTRYIGIEVKRCLSSEVKPGLVTLVLYSGKSDIRR
jgi:hypothetical protein